MEACCSLVALLARDARWGEGREGWAKWGKGGEQLASSQATDRRRAPEGA